jgi:hypothetical protein
LFLRNFLCHSYAMSDSVNGNAMVKHGELPERASARKKKKRWRRRSIELVNSKSKRISPSAGRNVGCDVAWKAEAASPLTDGNFRKLPSYPCAMVSLWSNHRSEWSCQWCHILLICIGLYIQTNLKRYKSKNFWAYDRLQEPDHSLGGYSHREHWSRTRWNIKIEQKKGNSELFCAGYDNGRREKGIHFWA